MANITNDSRQAGYLPVIESDNIADPTDNLLTFVAQIVGLPLTMVRRRWQQKPGTQPNLSESWASVAITDVKTWATPDSMKTKGIVSKPTSGSERRISHQTLTVSVWFYGPDALILADDFREGAYLGQNNDMLKKHGLTIQGVDDSIVHIPEYVFEQWLDKYEVKFKVGRAVVRRFGIRTIAGWESVSIETDIFVNR